MLLFGIKNCDSVRKAVKFCNANGIEYEFVDFKQTPVDEALIRGWLDTGATIKELFNNRSTTYRNLKLKEKNLGDEQKVEWMAKENLLIKRPVVTLNNGEVLVGFNESRYQELLTN